MIPWMLMAQRVQPPQGDDPKPRLDPIEVEKQSWVKGSSSDTTLSATVDAKSQIAEELSLHAALTSRTLVRIGPATNDEVAELIESMSDHRDRCLPRRGDPPSFATDTRSGRRSLYVNEGYRCIGDNVRGGILDLMPLKGTQFLHREWEHVETCMPYHMRQGAARMASWALSCIQADLRHRLVRAAGSTYLDKHNGAKLHTVIKCDEGGWVLVDDLIKMEVLWTHHTRRLTEDGSVRDLDQQKRIYNQKLQLLLNGKYLIAKQPRGAKIRLQFLGIKVKDPPAGPHQLGPFNSNMLVSKVTQIKKSKSCNRIAVPETHETGSTTMKDGFDPGQSELPAVIPRIQIRLRICWASIRTSSRILRR